MLVRGCKLQLLIKQGIDPIAEKKRPTRVELNTINDIAQDWLNECHKRLDNPQISERVYRKEISPNIGNLAIERVKSLDVLAIIRAINKSGRPTIANDALSYCKQIFNHGVKLGLIQNNPALVFDIRDAAFSFCPPEL